MTKRLARASTGARVGFDGISDTGRVTLSSNAGTANTLAGVITTESLSTAAGASQALTITNSLVGANDVVLAVITGVASAGTPIIDKVVPAAGSFVITLTNRHASAAFDDTVTIGFLVIKG